MENKQIVSDNILKPCDLLELTGYTLPARQADCLRKHGIFCIHGRDGQVRTTWHHVNHPTTAQAAQDVRDESDFNWEGFR